MALEFRPPEWLLQEYMNRKTPAEEASAGIQTALTNYLAIDEAKRRNARADQTAELERQKILMEQAKARREGIQMTYDYGYTGELPRNVQNELNNPNAPVEGPSNQIPMGYPESQQAQLGQAQGPVMPMSQEVAPQRQVSPIVAGIRDFLAQDPHGIKGRQFTEDTVIQKDNKGNEVSRSIVKRPISGKTIVSGPQAHGQGIWKPLYRTGNKITQQHSVTGEMREVDALGEEGATPQPVVPNAIPSAAIEKGAAQEGFLSLLDNIDKNYKKEYVGPLDSRVRKVSQKVDLPQIGLGASKQAADFERDVADLRSAIVNERTGAAVGERQEWDRLLELIPDDAKSDVDFKAKIPSIRQRYQKLMAQREAGYKKAGYRTSGAGTTVAPQSISDMSDEELERLANGG